MIKTFSVKAKKRMNKGKVEFHNITFIFHTVGNTGIGTSGNDYFAYINSTSSIGRIYHG